MNGIIKRVYYYIHYYMNLLTVLGDLYQGFKGEVSNLLISLLYVHGKLCAKNFK